MIEAIVRFSLHRRTIVLLAALVFTAYGVLVALRLPVDAFPDVTNVQVVVETQAPGLAAEEMEKLVTFPVESVMGGLPGVEHVRSVSKTGLSVVTVVFKDDVDIYFARQLVLERLQTARERIPEGLATPEMGPITTGLGQIYQYTLEGEGFSPMDLRTINDWMVKFQLRTVPGVADVLSFGGEVRQYQVKVDPSRLLKFRLTLDDVTAAVRANNTNAGGWYLSQGPVQYVIRGVGLIRGGREGLGDIGNIVLKATQGAAVRVRDVAEVEYGAEIRQGAVSKNGKGEVVSGIVLQLKGANTKETIERVQARVAEVRKSLPKGVRLMPYYDQSDLVDRAIHTVTKALGESAILVVIVLFLFLGNVRAAIVVISAIPLAMLAAFICMEQFGISANLQSLAGLAIGIGMMVDPALIIVENAVRRLSQRKEGESFIDTLHSATIEVRKPALFGELIIAIVFLPLFTLEGVEGKMFSPVAATIAFALLGALVVSVTIMPAVCSLALRGHFGEGDSRLVRLARAAYAPLLAAAMRRRAWIVVAAGAMLAAALAVAPRLGTEFVPELEEGTLCIRVTMHPSISLDESLRLGARVETRLLRFPEVTYAIGRIGRAELGGCPEPVSNNEVYVGLRPIEEWTTAKDRPALVRAMMRDLDVIPGLQLNFSQPIATRVDELLSGVRAQVAVKLFAEDLETLNRFGKEIESTLKTIPGATDVQLEQIQGEAQIVVEVDRDAIARYGVNVAEVMEIVSDAIGGVEVTEVVEGQKRFFASVRLAPEHRNDLAAIGALLVAAPDGVRIPLAQLADIRIEEGPPFISRENAQRRVVVLCNVRGRDLGGFVEEGKRRLDSIERELPPGAFVEWGGQFESQQRAQRTLAIVIPLAMGLIFALLYISLGTLRHSLLIMMNVPFALVGGIFSLYLTGQYLSVPSSIGFIALFGVAVLNGLVLVSCIAGLQQEGLPVDEAVRRGAMLRLRPVLMTATVTCLGLLPLLLARGVGAEIQRPLATVVVGGLFTSTALTLLVLPAVYAWFAPRAEGDEVV